MFNRLDHLIIAVEDLPDAINEYSKLFGFPPIWRGAHPKLGTQNALFSFENTYLELLAAAGDGAGADMVNSCLVANGEGLCGIALGTDDLDSLSEGFVSNGIAVSPITEQVGVSADGTQSRMWKSMFFPRRFTRGVLVFAIEHLSGQFSNQQLSSVQAKRLDHVVINTNDPEGAVGLYERALGLRLSLDQVVEDWGGRMLFFRINKTTIEVVGKEKDKMEPEDSLWGLAWEVGDLRMTCERLSRENIEVSAVRKGRKPNTLVASVKSHTRGVPTLLIQDLKRGCPG
mgnify:CR=1 FL=1